MGCSRSLSGLTVVIAVAFCNVVIGAGVFSVNPWRLSEVADAMNTALNLTVEQRKGRVFVTMPTFYVDESG